MKKNDSKKIVLQVYESDISEFDLLSNDDFLDFTFVVISIF